MAWLGVMKEGLLRGATVGMSLLIVQEYVGGVVSCHGPSMRPTIHTNDILITDHISPRLGRVKRGDVVIARSPENYQCICKRIVAEPGDIVNYKGQPIVIPKGYVWLEGDNKANSHDSRDWGPLPVSLLRRKCYMKIWPHFDMTLGKDGKIYAAAAVEGQESNSNQ